MFKKKVFDCALPDGAPSYSITKVIRKTDGESIDLHCVRDFSFNFNDYPRDLHPENFSIDAIRKSGMSVKEVDSVLFHDDKLSAQELLAIDAELNKDVEPLND